MWLNFRNDANLLKEQALAKSEDHDQAGEAVQSLSTLFTILSRSTSAKEISCVFDDN